MRYVDGYVLPVPKKILRAYRRMAEKAGKIWREHGVLEYREGAGDDLKVKFGVLFLRSVKAKPGETVVFSWIVFKSRGHGCKSSKSPRSWRFHCNRQPISCPSPVVPRHSDVSQREVGFLGPFVLQ